MPVNAEQSLHGWRREGLKRQTNSKEISIWTFMKRGLNDKYKETGTYKKKEW